MTGMIKKAIYTVFNKFGYSVVRKDTLKTLKGDAFAFSSSTIPRAEHMLSHPLVHGHPNVMLETYEIRATTEDVQLAARLAEAYRKSVHEEAKRIDRQPNDVWKILKQGKHREFVQLLEQNTPDALAAHLCNMSRQEITHGMAQGHDLYQRILSDEAFKSRSAVYYLDKLIALGEALGCLPYENPEQGKWGENLYTDIDEVVNRIEHVMGIDITPPKISSGLFGVASRKGLFHIRDITSLYTAWRVREILKHEKSAAVCEIGAGTGRTAYYCHKMGLKNLTIIDLPYVCVLSGYYLLKSLPEANIVLYGETTNPSPDSIKIYPYWCLSTLPDNGFDLTLNQDSFPEIGRETVIEYLHQIRRTTKMYFLSVNQEGQAPQTGPDNLQLVISRLIKTIGEAYERVYRFRYWVREGYVEELFRIVK